MKANRGKNIFQSIKQKQRNKETKKQRTIECRRKKMKKLLQNQKKNKFVLCVLLLALLASLALMAGCGNNDVQDGDADADGQDAAKETLVVGLDDAFAPMGFRDEQGNLVGFDIDLATAVADELGMQVEFKPIDWNAKEMELKAGTIDCVWNGMSITPERQENMALTNKYLNNKIVLMTLKTSSTDVTDASQLANLKIGTQADSAALEMLCSCSMAIIFSICFKSIKVPPAWNYS